MSKTNALNKQNPMVHAIRFVSPQKAKKTIREPLTEPYGEVITLDVRWAQKDIEKYNPSLKMYLWDHCEPDYEHYYSEFIGGKIYTLDKGQCRLCAKKIQPYTTKYYQKHYENGDKYCFLYDAEHFYCEECAKKEASEDYFCNVIPWEVNRFETRRDGETLETVVYADGSRIEELTSSERPRFEAVL